MSLLRHIPIKFRLPIIHSVLWSLAAWKSRAWPKASDGTPVKGPLLVSGFLNESSGIAQGAKDIITALEAAGQPLIAHDIRPCFAGFARGKAAMMTMAASGCCRSIPPKRSSPSWRTIPHCGLTAIASVTGRGKRRAHRLHGHGLHNICTKSGSRAHLSAMP
jgi:hypothetical protein